MFPVYPHPHSALDRWTNGHPDHLVPHSYYPLHRPHPHLPMVPHSSVHGGRINVNTGLSEIHQDKHKFQVKMDVSHFSPDELLIKSIGDILIIEGNHEEKEDEHGFITRFFRRKYNLPTNAEKDVVDCEISSDGQLKVTVRRIIPEEDEENVKHHKIKVTGQPTGF